MHELEIAETSSAIGPVLKEAGLVKSSSEAVRLIKQNAVSLDGEKVTDPYMAFPSGQKVLVKVGKLRLAYIHLTVV